MVASAKPHGPKDLNCPLHRRAMSSVCHKCAWWTSMSTIDPQTNKTIEDWACAISWMPKLAFESAKQTQSAGAAIETFRNEMKQTGDALVGVARTNQTGKLTHDKI